MLKFRATAKFDAKHVCKPGNNIKLNNDCVISIPMKTEATVQAEKPTCKSAEIKNTGPANGSNPLVPSMSQTLTN